jgi:hypothetical protein
MPHGCDPFIDDPVFRDPPIVNRYGRPVSHPSSNPGVLSTRAMLGIGALLLIFSLAYYGWNARSTGLEFAQSAPTTIGQAR